MVKRFLFELIQRNIFLSRTARKGKRFTESYLLFRKYRFFDRTSECSCLRDSFIFITDEKLLKIFTAIHFDYKFMIDSFLSLICIIFAGKIEKL